MYRSAAIVEHSLGSAEAAKLCTGLQRLLNMCAGPQRLLKAGTGSQHQKSEKYCHRKEYHEQQAIRLRFTPENFQIREKRAVHVRPMFGEIRKSKEFGWGNHFGKLYLMGPEGEGGILL